MAKLVDCKDCGHEVSERAKICPNCGVSDPGIKDPPVGAVLITLLLLFSLVGGAIYWFATQPTPEQDLNRFADNLVSSSKGDLKNPESSCLRTHLFEESVLFRTQHADGAVLPGGNEYLTVAALTDLHV